MTTFKSMVKFRTGMAVLLFLTSGFALNAQERSPYLSAKESEPRNFGWMQGFPPPADKVLRASDGSFFDFPALRWSVVHMREFLPTKQVSRGVGAPSELVYDLDNKIDKLAFYPTGFDKPMT